MQVDCSTHIDQPSSRTTDQQSRSMIHGGGRSFVTMSALFIGDKRLLNHSNKQFLTRAMPELMSVRKYGQDIANNDQLA